MLLGGLWLWGGSAQPTPPGPTRSPAPQLKFRLAGYPRKHNEGRIEVFYNDEWGTICDDDFTLANAQVLCRHLGFVAATGWAHSAKYGKGVGKRRSRVLHEAGVGASRAPCLQSAWQRGCACVCAPACACMCKADLQTPRVCVCEDARTMTVGCACPGWCRWLQHCAAEDTCRGAAGCVQARSHTGPRCCGDSLPAAPTLRLSLVACLAPALCQGRAAPASSPRACYMSAWPWHLPGSWGLLRGLGSLSPLALACGRADLAG